MDWWGNANRTLNSITVNSGTGVIHANLRATSGREGGAFITVASPTENATLTLTANWSGSFGTGGEHLKTIAGVVLTGANNSSPINASNGWLDRGTVNGNIDMSVTTTVDDCFLMRFCHDFDDTGNFESTMAGYTRLPDAFAYTSAFFLTDAGSAGLETSTYNPDGSNSQLTDFMVAIEPA